MRVRGGISREPNGRFRIIVDFWTDREDDSTKRSLISDGEFSTELEALTHYQITVSPVIESLCRRAMLDGGTVVDLGPSLEIAMQRKPS
jgi:hypothetical protein